MSYCRNNGEDSDIYLIGSFKHLECFGAGWRVEGEAPVHDTFKAPSYALNPVTDKIEKTGEEHDAIDSYYSNSRLEMIDHLLLHRDAGHKVPQRAIDRLREEISTVGDDYL